MENSQTHLAIINSKSISRIFKGEKDFDFWFGKTKKAPYQNVREGDEVLLKEPGGKIKGKAVVENVLFFNAERQMDIDKYGKVAMRAFAMAKERKARFVTIIFYQKIEKYLAPVFYRKKDQRRWATINKK